MAVARETVMTSTLSVLVSSVIRSAVLILVERLFEKKFFLRFMNSPRDKIHNLSKIKSIVRINVLSMVQARIEACLHGLINYIDTKAKCFHLKKLTCKGTLRQVLRS
jgi:hypothetical protein